MLIYNKEVIDKTTEWIEGSNNARLWLLKNNYEELVMLKDAVSRHSKPFEYLLIHKHLVLAAFINAVWDDKKAFKLLMDQKEFVWAAMANFINGDDDAAGFLQNGKLGHYLRMASVIQEKIRREGDEGTSIFSGPIKSDN